MVYCEDCKKFREIPCEYGDVVWCKLDAHVELDHVVRPEKKVGSQEQLEARNKDGKCKSFIPASWWDRFIRRW